MLNRAYLFIISSFFAIFAFAQLDKVNALSESKEWKAILYAINSPYFDNQSRSDSTKFFITSDGNNNVYGELVASIQEVSKDLNPENKINDLSFSCRFPARARFIRKHFFENAQINEQACVKLTAWRNRISISSATVVFSSYYLGNPSSTFGHTLLRLNNSGFNLNIKRELLSYGINYGANPWTTNPVIYSLGGLSGIFTGSFAAIPYYYKVREYNDYESRDLWEYDLDLTNDELNKLVDLTWEQGDNYFNYYFLTENCGYYIVALIEAAAPRLDMISKLHKWVIPSDTIGLMSRAGAFKSYKLRPSVYNQFLNRYEKLDNDEIIHFEKLVSNMNNPHIEFESAFLMLDENSKAKIIDTFLDYYDFKKSSHLLDLEVDKDPFKQKLLNYRSELPTAEKLNFDKQQGNSPDKAHGSLRFQLSALHDPDKAKSSVLLGVRFALHDLDDPKVGMPDNAIIEVMNTKLIFPTESADSISIKEIKVVEIGSYPEFNFWTNKLSYDVKLGFLKNDSLLCQFCGAGFLNTSTGISKKIYDFQASTLINFDYLYGSFDSIKNETGNHYFSIGPKLLVQYDVSSENQFRLESDFSLWNTLRSDVWTTEIVYRKNMNSLFSIDFGINKNETQTSYSTSLYIFND